MGKNEFDPDYNIETVIVGKEDIDSISTMLAEIDAVATTVEEARQINRLVLKCQTLICNWTCPKPEPFTQCYTCKHGGGDGKICVECGGLELMKNDDLKMAARIRAAVEKECDGCEFQDLNHCSWWRTKSKEPPPCLSNKSEN